MIISRTPYRVSFFGGGTDYPAWYREHGGAVVAATINRYCYINCRYMPPFFEHKSRIVWSEIEQVKDNAEISHPVVRAALRYLDVTQGVGIHHDGDLPARSGLGSSSAFTVGVLHALYALKGEIMSKAELARHAIYVGHELLKEHIGVQDQIQTAYGGLNKVVIRPDDTFLVEPLTLPDGRIEALQNHLLLFYTGVSRRAADVAKGLIAAISTKQAELHTIHEMVDQAVDLLANGSDIGDFSRLLHESWLLKRTLTNMIAPPFVNDIYERAARAGALGGKLLGAGGGGFILFVVRPEDQIKVLTALEELLVVPIEFDHVGTRIIFFERERYSRSALEGERSFRRYGNGGTS